jgi:hypothetical protein
MRLQGCRLNQTCFGFSLCDLGVSVNLWLVKVRFFTTESQRHRGSTENGYQPNFARDSKAYRTFHEPEDKRRAIVGSTWYQV